MQAGGKGGEGVGCGGLCVCGACVGVAGGGGESGVISLLVVRLVVWLFGLLGCWVGFLVCWFVCLFVGVVVVCRFSGLFVDVVAVMAVWWGWVVSLCVTRRREARDQHGQFRAPRTIQEPHPRENE